MKDWLQGGVERRQHATGAGGKGDVTDDDSDGVAPESGCHCFAVLVMPRLRGGLRFKSYFFFLSNIQIQNRSRLVY